MSTSFNSNQEWAFSAIVEVRGYKTSEFPHYRLRWAPSEGRTWPDTLVIEEDLASPIAIEARNKVWEQIKVQRPELNRSDFCWQNRRVKLDKKWIAKTEAEFYRSNTADSDTELSDLTSLSDRESESPRLHDGSVSRSQSAAAHPQNDVIDRNSPGSTPDEYAIHVQQRQPSPNLTLRSLSSQPTEFTMYAASPIHPTSSTSLQKLLSDSALRGRSTDSDVDIFDVSHIVQDDFHPADDAEPLPSNSDMSSTLSAGHWSGSLHIMLPPSDALILGAFSISFPSTDIPSHKGTLFEDEVLALEIHNTADVDQVLWLTEPPSHLGHGLLSPAPGNDCPDISGFADTLHLCQILVATPLGMVTLPGHSEPFRPTLFIRWSPDATLLSHCLSVQIAFFPLPKSLPKTLASAYAHGIFETVPSGMTFTVADFSSLELLALHALCWPVWLHDYLRTAKSTIPLDVIVFTGSGQWSQQVAFEANIILKILEKYNVRVLDDSAMDDPSVDIVFVHYDLLSTGAPLPPSSLRCKYPSRRHIAYGHLSSAIRPPFHACVEDTTVVWKTGGIVTMTPDILRYKSIQLDRILRKIDQDDAWKVILPTHVFGHALAKQQTGYAMEYDEVISDIRTENIELVRTSLMRNGMPDGPLRLFNAKDIRECCLTDDKTFKTQLEANSNSDLAEDDPWGLKTELKKLQCEIWRSRRFRRFVVLCSHREKVVDDTLEVLTCEAFIETL